MVQGWEFPIDQCRVDSHILSGILIALGVYEGSNIKLDVEIYLFRHNFQVKIIYLNNFVVDLLRFFSTSPREFLPMKNLENP